MSDVEFYVAGVEWLQSEVFELWIQFALKTYGDRNSVEHLFQDNKQTNKPGLQYN